MVDTPISEQGFTAAAIGASATGARTVSDLMFADFAFETAGQIFLQAAKLRYMSNGAMSAPVVIRVGAGALRSSGPHHSGIYHPIFAHMPGLIVCVPSNPADAKGLMKTALRAADPVIMLEPKALFASKGEVPSGEHYVPSASRASRASARTSPSSPPARWSQRTLEAADALAAQGVEAEIIDLRTIMPLDVDTIVASVGRRTRLLVVDEAWAMCGLGGEIAQTINELAFDELDAPPGRLHTAPTSHPVRAPVLERAMLVDAARIERGALDVIAGLPPVPDHWYTVGLGSASRQGLPQARLPAAAPAPARAVPRRSPRRRAGDHAVRRPHRQRGQGGALAEGGGRQGRGRRTDRRDRDRQGQWSRSRRRWAAYFTASTSRSGRWCRWAAASAASSSNQREEHEDPLRQLAGSRRRRTRTQALSRYRADPGALYQRRRQPNSIPPSAPRSTP